MFARTLRQLRSFHRRRIALPVTAASLVLDVGSGDKPHWRADVLLDRYIETTHGGQRSGTAKARISRPLFDADAAAMPFGDKVFDVAICSHVLEHVPDPAGVVRELTRVSKAGYIEVPEAASAKILDFPSHLWWCRLEGDTLVFRAKGSAAFDADIAGYLQQSGLTKRMAKLLDSEFDHRVVGIWWTDTVDVLVEGQLDAAFIAAGLATEAHHQTGQTLISRAVTAVATLPYRRLRRRAPVLFDDVVRPELRRGTAEVLTRKVYSVD